MLSSTPCYSERHGMRMPMPSFMRQGRGEVICAVTTLSIANLFYIGRRLVGTQQARSDVRTCLNTLQILAVDRQALIDADALAGLDFEDNIQIAAAVATSLDAIVTRDLSGFSHAPLAVWSPSELLQRLAQQHLPDA